MPSRGQGCQAPSATTTPWRRTTTPCGSLPSSSQRRTIRSTASDGTPCSSGVLDGRTVGVLGRQAAVGVGAGEDGSVAVTSPA